MRAIVTGMGAVSPGGTNVADVWRHVLDGTVVISQTSELYGHSYPVRFCGRLFDFDTAAAIEPHLVRQTDRSTRLGLVAAEEAIRDASLREGAYDPLRVATVSSTSAGGFEFTHREIRKLWATGPRAVSVYESFAWFYAVNTGQISIRHNFRGNGSVLVTGDAGSLDSVGSALGILGEEGNADTVVAGGAESALDPWSFSYYSGNPDFSRASDKHSAYVPFDERAQGHVPAEGAAFLVLERPSPDVIPRAYAEILGYASTFDPSPKSGQDSNLDHAIALALADAGLRPVDIDVVYLDACGTIARDSSEARALERVFGQSAHVPATAPKAGFGRAGAASGVLDLVAAIVGMREGVVPGTPNCSLSTVPYEISIDPSARTIGPRSTAAVISRGAGGFNAVLIVSNRYLEGGRPR